MANTRAARIGVLIQRVVASSLQRELHDPRLRGVTITEVRVTGDLQIARIYWTLLTDPNKARGERKRAEQALRQSAGRLRSHVGHKAGLRLTPQLEFIYDELPTQAHEIDDVLVVAKKRDEELERSREGAQYAGEEDPYRHPREDEDDDFDDEDDEEFDDESDEGDFDDESDDSDQFSENDSEKYDSSANSDENEDVA
ncbi:MAG: 30S ribosome-binding factor RbfA [Aeriscardovia aeriphila]|nr:30S ribosome-binding factor RbfA [Aeriscardovia aeriphila]